MREAASELRKILGIPDTSAYIDVEHLIEFGLYKLDPEFDFQVLSIEEMGDKHAETFPDEKVMQIREDVYIGACNGKGRDRFTFAHELYHLLFNKAERMSFCRREEIIPIYENPEWQADCFAGEFLMPHHLIKNMGTNEIITVCKVSEDAAICQKSKC